MAFISETKVATETPKKFTAEPASEFLMVAIAAVAGYRLTKRQIRKLKAKLLLKAFTVKVKNLLRFKKKDKDPGFAILLVGLAIAGLALLLGASTLTAVLVALVICAIIGAMAYSND